LVWAEKEMDMSEFVSFTALAFITNLLPLFNYRLKSKSRLLRKSELIKRNDGVQQVVKVLIFLLALSLFE
jgi:hypothetical protein